MASSSSSNVFGDISRPDEGPAQVARPSMFSRKTNQVFGAVLAFGGLVLGLAACGTSPAQRLMGATECSEGDDDRIGLRDNQDLWVNDGNYVITGLTPTPETLSDRHQRDVGGLQGTLDGYSRTYPANTTVAECDCPQSVYYPNPEAVGMGENAAEAPAPRFGGTVSAQPASAGGGLTLSLTY